MKTLYWLAAATILIILAAACGSDSSDEGSADIAASFSFEAFGNENFDRGPAHQPRHLRGPAHRAQLLVPLVPAVPP